MPEARCLCGDHVWRVDAPLELLHHCHCGICRKHQGVAYSTVGGVAPDAFHWVSRGELISYRSSPDLERLSCARCGSSLPGEPGEIGLVFAFAGPLEGDPGSRPETHIFAASKAPWFDIDDGLECFDAYPPGFDAPVHPTPCSSEPEGDGVRGSCLCGSVRFSVMGPPILARHCHCLRCRRARAGMHASNMVLAPDALRFDAGEDRVRSYKVPDARFFAQSFCGDCGSPMPRIDTGRQIAIVPMGSLDDDPGVRPQDHIWAESRAAWFEIPGDLPQYPEGPPAS